MRDRLLADLLVALHLGFILFVVLGGLLALRWRRAVWIHIPAALWGAWIEIAGWICPLTPPGHIGEFATGAQSNWGPRTPQVSRLAFSPDGSRLAYVGQNPGVPGGNSVFVDGEALASGHAFAYPVFSPDSHHFAAAVLFDQQWQIVVDGRAGPAYREIVAYGPNAVKFLDNDTLRVLAVKDGSIYRVVLDLGG